jgi:hypothetical protein
VVNSNTWKNKECKKKSLGLPSVLGRDNYDGWLGYNIQTENINGERFIFLRKSWSKTRMFFSPSFLSRP